MCVCVFVLEPVGGGGFKKKMHVYSDLIFHFIPVLQGYNPNTSL